ncbi:23142_t:CDS:1, partial [Entrophospora sp. SA101]
MIDGNAESLLVTPLLLMEICAKLLLVDVVISVDGVNEVVDVLEVRAAAP